MFIHRNVANLVVHNDVNLMSVVQYSVENLLVDHIIVCGHTNCGGVKAAMDTVNLGMMNKWLVHIKDVAHNNKVELKQIKDMDERYNRR
ncbi:MAG: carbonic anhydrase [Bacteriovoracaceae bacterium]